MKTLYNTVKFDLSNVFFVFTLLEPYPQPRPHLILTLSSSGADSNLAPSLVMPLPNLHLHGAPLDLHPQDYTRSP